MTTGVQLGSAWGSIEIGTEGAQKSVESLAATMRSAGQSLSLGITAPLMGVAAVAINSAAGLEQSMNIMQQVTGATEVQMAALQSQALQMGAETSFSAGEVADAMLEMAKAGMEPMEVSAALAGVLDLAAAGGVGMADAANLVSAAINSFGLEASDSTDIANLFAATANASAAEISDLGAGFQQAGFAFAATGQETDDLAASLAILTNVGLTGSDAGTALKNAMMRLMNPTKEAAEAMASVGFQAYDMQGNMLPVVDIIANLNRVTAGMSNQQRDAFLSTVFMSDGMKAMIPLMEQGADGFLEMKSAVNQESAAADVAGARMKGFGGAVEYLKGSIDSFLIGTALPFLDNLSGIVRTVADAITGLSGLPEPVRNAALAFGAVLAAAGPVLLALSGIAAVIGFITSPIGLLVLAVAGLAAAWTANFGGIQETTAAAWEAIRPSLEALAQYLTAVFEDGDYLNDWLTHLPEAVQPAVLALGKVVAWLRDAALWLIGALPAALAWLQSTWDAAWPAIQATWDSAWAAISAAWAAAATWLQTDLPAALATLQAMWDTAWPAMQAAWDTAWTTLRTGFETARTWLETTMPGALTTLQTAFGNVKGGIDALPTALTNAKTQFDAVMVPIGALGDQLSTLFAPAIERVQAAFATLPEKLGPVLPKLQEMAAAFGGVLTALQPLVQVVGAGLAIAALIGVNAFAAVVNALPGIVGVIIDQVTASFKLIATVLTEVVNLVKAVIDGDWAAMWTSAQTIFQAFVEYFRGHLKRFRTLAETIFTAIYDTVTNTLDDLGIDIKPLLDTIKSTWDGVWNTLKDTVQPVIDIVGTVWEKIQQFADFLGGLSLPNPFQALADAAGKVADSVGLGGGEEAKAGGTSYFRGGYTRINERGDEGIILPAGSRVLTNGQTNNLAASQGRSVTINLGGVTIRNDMDLHRLRYELGTMLAEVAG